MFFHLRIYTEVSLIAHVAPNGNRQKGLKLGTAKPAVNLQQMYSASSARTASALNSSGVKKAPAQKIW